MCRLFEISTLILRSYRLRFRYITGILWFHNSTLIRRRYTREYGDSRGVVCTCEEYMREEVLKIPLSRSGRRRPVRRALFGTQEPWECLTVNRSIVLRNGFDFRNYHRWKLGFPVVGFIVPKYPVMRSTLYLNSPSPNFR